MTSWSQGNSFTAVPGHQLYISLKKDNKKSPFLFYHLQQPTCISPRVSVSLPLMLFSPVTKTTL
jgi:hypothetical protein